MSVITKSGDSGSTSLTNSQRVSKADLVVESYGSVDELQSQILHLSIKDADNADFLKSISSVLTKIMKCLSCQDVSISISDSIESLEQYVYTHESKYFGFVYQYSDELGYEYNILRTVTRRVERTVIRYFNECHYNSVLECARYLNRLSDVFYTMSLVHH